jgi:hypothetical protein
MLTFQTHDPGKLDLKHPIWKNSKTQSQSIIY